MFHFMALSTKDHENNTNNMNEEYNENKHEFIYYILRQLNSNSYYKNIIFNYFICLLWIKKEKIS